MVNWTRDDDYKLIEKHTEVGDNWYLIAKYLTEQRISDELGEITANDVKNRWYSEIFKNIKDLSNLEGEIINLEKYYKEKTDTPNYYSLLSEDSYIQKELSDIRKELNNIYLETIADNKTDQKEIDKKNSSFEENKLELDKKLGEYIINKGKKNSSSVYKLDIYDRNIEDNLFLIYYFLSYGILGLFIYKLLK